MRMLGQLKAVMIMSTGSEHFRTGTATQIPVTLRNNVGTREVQMLDNLGRQVGSLEESVAKAVYGLLECGEMRIMGIVQGPLKATYISPVILSFYANHALAVEILGLFESFGMHLDQSSAETQSTLRDLGQESNLLTRGMSYKARLPTRDDDGLLSLDANSDANVPSVFKGMNFKPSRGEGSSFPREKGAGSEYWARIKGKRNHQRLPQTMVVEKVTDTPEDGKTRLANIKSTFVTLLDLPEMDPPTQVLTPLRRHQKQALYFMVQRETEGIDIQDIGGNAGAPFPKLWIPTEDANFGGGSAIRYRHTLTNIKSLQKPDSMLGGILADDMGLGKTLSIIALVLSMPAAWVRGTRMKFTDSHGDASATASGPVSRSNTRPSGRTATRGRIRPMGRVVRRRGNSASKGKGKEPAIADDTTVVVDSSDDSDFLGEVSMPSRRQHVQESDISDPESLVDDPLAPPSPQSSEKSTALNDLSQLPSDSSDDDYDGAFADGGDQYVVDNTPMTPPPDYDNMATRRKEECERRFAKNYHGRYAGGTLIVCPLSTMGNWEEQVASHVRSRALSIYSYHGPGRIQNPKKLCEYDIVLTTYNVVQSEYSKETKQMVIEDHEPNEARSVFDSSSEEESNTKLFQIPDDPYVSALQAVHWHRIVLDEAHTIKEKRTICSQAAGALTADRRWCLTGTPIQNRLDDLYSLLRFLHAAPLSTWKVWLTYIAAPFHENIQDLIGDEGDNGSFEQGNIGAHRVQRLMQTICLRRMKQQIDMKTNRTMIELPPKFEVIRWLELSEGERRLYKMAEDIARNKYQQMSRNGTLLKNYMHILKIILRLRQLCTHPKLWSDDKWKEAKVLGADATIASQRGSRSRPHQDAETTPAADDGQHIPQAKTERKPKREAKPKVEVKPNAETKPKVETKPKAESAQDIKQNPMSAVDLCSMVMDNVDADSQSQQQTHTQPQPQTQTQTQEVERLQDEDIYEVWAKQVSIAGESVRCEFCHEQALPTAVFDRRDSYQPDDEPGPAVTRCGHISCHLCKAVLFETLMDGAMTECMLCGNMLDQSDVVNIPARIVFNSVSRRRQSQQVVVQMEEGADGAEYEELNRLCQEHDSSTKVATLIQDLKMIRQRKWITDPHFAVDQDDPLVQSRKEELEQHTEIREKSVVFSQWTKMLDIIGQQLEQYGIRFTRLDGTMTRPTRENHLRLFKRDPDVEVLLISLRAGGVGLNLAYATHVFMMDAFWNPSVELQAIDRIHRLGQRHPITVTRYFIKESIEEKIMALQRRKARIVDVSLMDSTRNKGPGSGGSDNEEESLAITTGTHSRQQRLDDLNLLFG
ncbi:hypothetical protein LPJ53_000498 [Coemansia erecta]|uniref:P-loop containing nucleoside triphosphate hydrolase protein n=1 Tax=Coemansia erecta TaxID=147472 RepID=A0A9W7Y5B1_9FUNG|nr:hypothetical protein LPJ53_000498 [Coemansia erecta]